MLSSLVSNAYMSEVILTPTSGMEAYSDDPRTEIESHAKLVIFGLDSFVFESTGRICNVQPFGSDLGITKNVPIVDEPLAYDCPYSGIVYVLVVRNALHAPSMDHNLIPPFILRIVGVIVNDVPKIQCEDSAVDND